MTLAARRVVLALHYLGYVLLLESDRLVLVGRDGEPPSHWILLFKFDEVLDSERVLHEIDKAGVDQSAFLAMLDATV